MSEAYLHESFTESQSSSQLLTVPDGDYNETYDDSANETNLILLTKILPSVLIYLLTFVVGFFGNLLVLIVIIRVKKLQNFTNLFLFSLATADLTLILICVPIKITEFLSNHWVFGPYMCKIFHYIQNIIAICSVLNLTAMSLERYIAILHPLKAKYMCTRKRVKLIVFSIWIFSFIAALPILYGKRAVKTGHLQQVYICIRVWDNDPIKWRIFELYRSFLILFVPFVIIFIAYSRICIKLWKLPSTRRKLTETFESYTQSTTINKSASRNMIKTIFSGRNSENNEDAKNEMSDYSDDGIEQEMFKLRAKRASSQKSSLESDNSELVKSVTISTPLSSTLTNGIKGGSRMNETSMTSSISLGGINSKRVSNGADLKIKNGRFYKTSFHFNNKTDDLKTRKQIIKMLICIICIFFISWTPITINNLLVSFDFLSNVNGGKLWHLRVIFYAMSYVNSCLNPVVYALMSRNFREAYQKIFKIKPKKSLNQAMGSRYKSELKAPK